MSFCTIANAGRLPHLRVLARGLGEHHPGARLTVLALSSWPAHEHEPFDVIRPEPPEEWDRLLAAGRWLDLAEVLKPGLLARVAAESGRALYLDACADVQAPLDPLMRALEHHPVVVSPRLLGDPPADGLRPDGDDLRRAGRLGAALAAVDDSDAAARITSWLTERVTRSARMLAPASLHDPHYPQRELSRWMDLAYSVFAEVGLLSDLGSAVSYWNLHQRTLSEEDGHFLVEGRPLRFAHFEGFDPSRPYLLREGANRVRTSDSAAIAALCKSYADRLVEAGWRDPRRRAEVGRRLPNGVLFDNRLSHLLADAADAGEDFGDVFDAAGAERFMRWLERPAGYGSELGVNRYLYRVYRERDDLQAVYPDLDGEDGIGFVGWAHVFGVVEMAMPERFLPPLPPGLTVRRPQPEAPAARPSLPRGARPDISVNVTGLFTGTLGLGEAARGYVRALEAAAIPVSTSTVDVRQFVKLSGTAHEGYASVEYAGLDGAASRGFNLICINADELPSLAKSAADDLFERPAIGVWAWETDRVPDRWRDSFGLLDEIWVYSTYVAENLGRVAPIPVRRVPPPVSPPNPGDVTLDLGIPDGFRFLFMFDFFSTIQRKNPIGLIEAFRRAFEPGEGPQLVIKTINGVHRHEALEEVRWSARGRPDVHVIDRSLSALERDALVAGCDCYASLHRSEGFGLTLAECMALGKPVIGTAFSGPTDFMHDANGYLVPYTMTRVGADCEIYPPDGTWAEPDVEEAARILRRVVENPQEARAKGERGRLDIQQHYSPAAIGRLIKSELVQLTALWTAERITAR